MEALSEKQVEELQRHLVKRHPRFRSRTVTKMVKLINDVRLGIIKPSDWFPKYEGILKVEDILENLQVDKWLSVTK